MTGSEPDELSEAIETFADELDVEASDVRRLVERLARAGGKTREQALRAMVVMHGDSEVEI